MPKMVWTEDQDNALIELLANGLTIRESAERMGISTSTVDRRKADPEFFAKYAIEVRANAEEIMQGLTYLLPDAYKAQADAIRGEEVTQVQMKASNYVMDRVLGKAAQTIEHKGGIESKVSLGDKSPQEVEELFSQMVAQGKIKKDE